MRVACRYVVHDGQGRELALEEGPRTDYQPARGGERPTSSGPSEVEEELVHVEQASVERHREGTRQAVCHEEEGQGQGQEEARGQPGHPRHDRQEFAASEIDFFYEYRVEHCDCGCRLQDGAGREDQVIQQVEIQAAPIRIEEHRAKQGQCPRCGCTYKAILPPEVRKAGLIGPRLTALVAYMKGVCHASFSTIRKFLRDVVGVTVSRGQLAKLVRKVSTSIDPIYDELINRGREASQDPNPDTGRTDRLSLPPRHVQPSPRGARLRT